MVLGSLLGRPRGDPRGSSRFGVMHLGALLPKKPSRIPKEGPKSRPRHPQWEKNGTGAPLFGVSGGPKMTKNQ